jgi:hypothetical protein
VMELDRSLQKVSFDAHELLVHAEERVESERRLRQSLYVQTCEIIGRLLCELRQMVTITATATIDPTAIPRAAKVVDATKELIIGRLCHLLKFRLTSLRTLLAHDSSPANTLALQHSSTGMISTIDLQSAFDLADDNEDGLVTTDDAVDVVDSAFSGTPFQGSNIVRETLFLSKINTISADQTQSEIGTAESTSRSSLVNTKNATVTFCELTLLTARGLRHDNDSGGALRAVQKSLDHIISLCFQHWSKSSLHSSVQVFKEKYQDLIECATSLPDEEWQRMFCPTAGSSISSTTSIPCRGVSPCVTAFLLNVGSILNTNVSPSDCTSPVPNANYALALGVDVSETYPTISSFMEIIRWSLLDESLNTLASTMHAIVVDGVTELIQCGVSSLAQLFVDAMFVKNCFVSRNQVGFNTMSATTNRLRDESICLLDGHVEQLKRLLQSNTVPGSDVVVTKLLDISSETQQRINEASNLFVSSMFGPPRQPNVDHESNSTTDMNLSSALTEPMFHLPLPSSRRFVLLPVQVDRSLTDIESLRNQYDVTGKESTASMNDHHSNHNDGYSSSNTSGNVISDGFGFLSSMLKTKK